MEKWMVEGLDQEDREAIIDKNQVRDCLVYFEWLAKKKTIYHLNTLQVLLIDFL